MKKIIFFTVILAVCIIPILIFGQDQSSKNFLQFMTGDGGLEQWFMKAFAKIDTNVNIEAAKVAMVGRAIGAFGAICYLGYLGWQMQEGARPWEVTPMIRPVIIALILSNWGGFTSLIASPFQAIATPGEAIFNSIEVETEAKRVKVFELQYKMLEKVINTVAEQEAKDKVANQKWYDKIIDAVSDSVDKLLIPIEQFKLRMEYQFQYVVGSTMESIALWIFRICVYLIFMFQKIWMYILIVLGPIAVGMSLIPGFENSLQNWIAKFININLYTFIGYTIINIGQQMIQAAYDMQIDRLTAIVEGEATDASQALLVNFVSGLGFIESVGFTVVAYSVCGFAMFLVPTIADSIVTAGGAGIMSKGKNAASKAIGTAISAGKVAASTVASGGSAGLATAGKEIAKKLG